MAPNAKSFIQFVPNEKGVQVRFGYPLYKNEEEEGFINYYIPGFNLFYSAPSEEIGKKRASKMIKAFIHYWITKESPRAFILEVHKLGFRTPNHDLVMKEFLHKRIAKSKFNSSSRNIPTNFGHETIEEEEFNLVA